MKSIHLPLVAIVVTTINAQFSIVSAQGVLNPPGPPAPTMKALDQLEPRTPITSVPFTIATPGSYYLTANLQFTAATGNAITITVGNVTVDLMGFTLSSTSAVSGDGIHVNSGLRNVTAKKRHRRWHYNCRHHRSLPEPQLGHITQRVR